MPAPSIRTIQIWAQGFGTTPASIEASVNGSVVFSGPVPTIDEPMQDQGGSQFKGTGQLVFSFDIPFDFVGQVPVSISVTDNNVIVTNSFYNYVIKSIKDGKKEYGGPDFFVPISTGSVSDPKTFPKINNILQIPNRADPYLGEWYWPLATGDVLTFDLEISTPGLYDWRLDQSA